MNPHYAAEGVTVYQGEALAVLADLPSGSVDALITDPPYSSGGMVRADRAGATVSKYVSSMNTKRDDLVDFSGDNRDQRAYGYWCALWLAEAMRVVKPGGVAMLFTDWRQLPATTDALQAGGWVWRGLVPWYKPVARPQAGRFTNQCEYVVWGSHGPMTTDYSAPVLPGFYQASSPRERQHITQKPLEVMRAMVRIAPPGGVVLDPFAGSGTTGVAALLEGREFIGAERVPHYADVIVDRLSTVERGYKDDGEQGAFDLEGETA